MPNLRFDIKNIYFHMNTNYVLQQHDGCHSDEQFLQDSCCSIFNFLCRDLLIIVCLFVPFFFSGYCFVYPSIYGSWLYPFGIFKLSLHLLHLRTSMDRGTFFYMKRQLQNVLRSTLLHANKTTTKCIQFLIIYIHYIYVFINVMPQTMQVSM